MFVREKWFMILIAIFTLSILSACGAGEEKEEVEEAAEQDDGVVEEEVSQNFIPISDGLEEYSLWFKVEGDPFELTRHSVVDDVFVIEDGKVQQYRARDFELEDFIDMSDEEIIEEVKERLREVDDNEDPEPVDYTLDITLDDVGQYPEFISLETEPERVFSVIEETSFQTIFDTRFSGLVYYQDDRSDYEEMIITRVEDDSIYFKLDDPDTSKDVVTVEQAEELEELREKKKEAEEEEMAEEAAVVDPEEAYRNSCASCHADDLSGSVGPGLKNIGSKLSEEEIYDIIVNGKGSMPAGVVQDDEAAHAIAEWLSGKE